MATAQYTGIGGVARKVKSKYIGVAGVARNIVSSYIGVGNVARQYFSSKKYATFTDSSGNVTKYPIEVGQLIVLTDSGSFTTEQQFYANVLVLGSGFNGINGYSASPLDPTGYASGGSYGSGGYALLGAHTFKTDTEHQIVVGKTSNYSSSATNSSIRADSYYVTSASEGYFTADKLYDFHGFSYGGRGGFGGQGNGIEDGVFYIASSGEAGVGFGGAGGNGGNSTGLTGVKGGDGKDATGYGGGGGGGGGGGTGTSSNPNSRYGDGGNFGKGYQGAVVFYITTFGA